MWNKFDYFIIGLGLSIIIGLSTFLYFGYETKRNYVKEKAGIELSWMEAAWLDPEIRILQGDVMVVECDDSAVVTILETEDLNIKE